MSVLLETSLGDIVIDLNTELCPRSSANFLKLCSKHYYKFNAFFNVTKDFLAQTGDPTNTGKGGSSFWSQLPSTSKERLDDPFFHPDLPQELRHVQKGTVSFACSRISNDANGSGTKDEEAQGETKAKLIAGSQFFITLADEIDSLDGKHAPFGMVVEGQEPGGTLDKINAAFVDDQKRPLKDIRLRHVVVLEDPFPDPEGFQPPSRSPSPTPSQIRALRLADDEELVDEPDSDAAEEKRRQADTNAAALTLEMVGDLPFAEIRPPENILFVCKLNPVTQSDDLELIFSRFGKILSCEVIKDKKTGDSLQYAFIEFDKKEDAERAYFKMQNVLVDDRRIWVDFSQSVSKLHGDWVKKRNGGREAPQGHYRWNNSSGNSNGRGGDKSRVDSYQPSRRQDDRRGSTQGRYADQRSRREYEDDGDREHRTAKRSRYDDGDLRRTDERPDRHSDSRHDSSDQTDRRRHRHRDKDRLASPLDRDRDDGRDGRIGEREKDRHRDRDRDDRHYDRDQHGSRIRHDKYDRSRGNGGGEERESRRRYDGDRDQGSRYEKKDHRDRDRRDRDRDPGRDRNAHHDSESRHHRSRDLHGR